MNVGIMSVEIITLSQHLYEHAFELLSNSLPNFNEMSLDEMSSHVDDMIPKLNHIRPHIKMYGGSAIIVIDCMVVDSQIMDYASQLLSIMPTTTPGSYWEYLNTEN